MYPMIIYKPVQEEDQYEDEEFDDNMNGNDEDMNDNEDENQEEEEDEDNNLANGMASGSNAIEDSEARFTPGNAANGAYDNINVNTLNNAFVDELKLLVSRHQW